MHNFGNQDGSWFPINGILPLFWNSIEIKHIYLIISKSQLASHKSFIFHFRGESDWKITNE